MDELTTRVKKYVDVHGSKPFKKKVTAPDVEIKIPEFDPNLFKRPVRDPGSDSLEKRYNEIVRQQEEEKRRTFSEADLEGALSNDSLTDSEKEMLRKEELSFKETKKRRDKDNQLAHAIDLIEGLSVLSVKE